MTDLNQRSGMLWLLVLIGEIRGGVMRTLIIKIIMINHD
jgi:hypothetical protein